MPVNKSSEYYFNILVKDKNIEELTSSQKINLSMDDHDIWEELSDEDAEIVNAKLEDIIKNAVKECESKGWGTVPLSIKKELIKRFSNKINWGSLLKRFCGYARSEDRRSSLKRLNRKYTGIHPGIKKSYKPKIAIYVDESGSMTAETLSMLYGELESLSKHTDFYLYKFDTQVNDKDGFLWKKGKKLNITRKLSGGTCFNSPTKHAMKNKKLFDGYIIMTDGCAAKPEISHGIKRAWILIPNTNLAFAPDRKDVVIKINK